MTMGFRPSNNTRQPVYGVQVYRKLGYIDRKDNQIWFTDVDGKKIARILKYKAHPGAECNISSGNPTQYGWNREI